MSKNAPKAKNRIRFTFESLFKIARQNNPNPKNKKGSFNNPDVQKRVLGAKSNK